MNITGTRVLVFSENRKLYDAIEPTLDEWELSLEQSDDLEEAQKLYETHSPHVLIIAVEEIEHAEATLSVIRISEQIQPNTTHTTRTLILCDQESASMGAKLKFDRAFDDYIIASPLQDAERIKVTIAHAIQLPPSYTKTNTEEEKSSTQKKNDLFRERLKEQVEKNQAFSQNIAEQLEKYQHECAKQIDHFENNVCSISGSEKSPADLMSNLKTQCDGLRDTILNDTYTKLCSNIMEPTEQYTQEVQKFVGSLENEDGIKINLLDNENSDKKCILIVEDDAKSAKMLEATLNHLGYKTEISTNGADAITAATCSRPDLILMDVMMPGMDGFQATKEIRRTHSLSKVPVFFLTALATKSAVEQAKGLGGCQYIRKPIHRKSLVAKIESLFDH